MKKKIIKEVEDLLAGRESLKRSLLNKIDKAEAEAESARREMEKATKAEDEAAFCKAADRERFNNSVIANCKERLEAMENIPTAEAAAMLQQIMEAIQATEAEATKKAASSVKAFCEIAANAESEIDELQALASRYANATGNGTQARLYNKSTSELLKLYGTIKGNRNRVTQLNARPVTGVDPINGALYDGVK